MTLTLVRMEPAALLDPPRTTYLGKDLHVCVECIVSGMGTAFHGYCPDEKCWMRFVCFFGLGL
jgi:hypothetical protein